MVQVKDAKQAQKLIIADEIAKSKATGRAAKFSYSMKHIARWTPENLKMFKQKVRQIVGKTDLAIYYFLCNLAYLDKFCQEIKENHACVKDLALRDNVFTNMLFNEVKNQNQMQMELKKMALEERKRSAKAKEKGGNQFESQTEGGFEGGASRSSLLGAKVAAERGQEIGSRNLPSLAGRQSRKPLPLLGKDCRKPAELLIQD